MSNAFAEECELTVRKILRRGFRIDSMRKMSTIELGKEQRTGVSLVISAEDHSVYNITHLDPGIREGLYDLAKEGRMAALAALARPDDLDTFFTVMRWWC
ncbi:hypothetical protein F4677DRAFT_446807 [Hypoxylon crocopeplum]|nr:hypothetical protein F4677DRAFT_446807 [Hypoxylon crocopeplum]